MPYKCQTCKSRKLSATDPPCSTCTERGENDNYEQVEMTPEIPLVEPGRLDPAILPKGHPDSVTIDPAPLPEQFDRRTLNAMVDEGLVKLGLLAEEAEGLFGMPFKPAVEAMMHFQRVQDIIRQPVKTKEQTIFEIGDEITRKVATLQTMARTVYHA